MKVISALTGKQVALWERHPAHPGGEVFVVGDRVVEVALTAAVRRALAQGRLVEVVEAPEDVLHSGATVEDVLEAVEAGAVTAAEALAWEQARPRPRVTLVEALEAQLGEADADEEPGDEGDESVTEPDEESDGDSE